MAISKDEVKKLAELSRLELSEAEVEKMQTEIESILSYVATVQKVELKDSDDPSPHLQLVNVMREDRDAVSGGAYTDKILDQAPRREGRLVKVKKILG